MHLGFLNNCMSQTSSRFSSTIKNNIVITSFSEDTFHRHAVWLREDDAHARDGCRRGVVEVPHLKDHARHHQKPRSASMGKEAKVKINMRKTSSRRRYPVARFRTSHCP